MTFVYQCVQCGRIFTSRRAIRRHLQEEHNVDDLTLDYFVSAFRPLRLKRWWLFL